LTTPGVRLGDLLSRAGLGDGHLWLPGPPRPAHGLTPAEAAGPLVTDVVLASKQVAPGAIFACIRGANADGHDFAAEAVAHGAVALLCERRLDLPVAQVVVGYVREVLGSLSAAFWDFPSSKLRVVGVTGTNGKTTTCALLASIFEAHGWPTGVIGTLTGSRTTPEAPALQRRLAELVASGAGAVAMEVSSHSLVQHRVDGAQFAAAVFNNLSQDHLDYHGTMEDYFEAKALLFTGRQVRLAVVNTSDPWGARLAERLASQSGSSMHVVGFSPADATSVELSPHMCRFTWRGRQLELDLGGRFNISNAVAAATAAIELGVTWDALAEGLRSVPLVEGRFQAVEEGQPFGVLVDFAHTPAALAESLRAARELAEAGRVIVVFGAGGDRDKVKRPLMGGSAAELADLVIVTSDNPRSEDPASIRRAIMAATPGAMEIAGRADAIAAAIANLEKGDVLLVAGKGHETGQIVGKTVIPYSDHETVASALAADRTRRASHV